MSEDEYSSYLARRRQRRENEIKSSSNHNASELSKSSTQALNHKKDTNMCASLPENGTNRAKWPPPKLTVGDFSRASGPVDAAKLFNIWYAEHIEPLGGGVAVFAQGIKPGENTHWVDGKFDGDAHRAILIGIEPLKEETAEDLLAEFASYEDWQHTKGKASLNSLKDKARAYLNKRGVK